jgi:predicted histidine transporter YuiF (NhaC family)
MAALVLYLFLALMIIGLLVAFWKGYKQHQIRQVARQGQWTAAETLAALARKKGRRRVWVAVAIVCVILASYPW